MKTKQSSLSLLFFFSLLTFYFSPELNATIRYVSKTGSSTPPYTSWATAADSIQKCINICEYGDTIYVANGVYKEKIVMIPGLSLIGAGMDSCVIDTRQFPATTDFYSVSLNNNSLIEGFKIYCKRIDWGTGIYVYGSLNIIKNNKILFAKYGVDIYTYPLGYNLIELNHVINTDYGIYCSFTNSLISNNIIIYPNVGLSSGLYNKSTYLNNVILYPNYDGFDGFTHNSILKNNFFLYEFRGGPLGSNTGISSYGDTIINNAIIGWPSYGHGFSGNSATLKNNHFENNYSAIQRVGGGSDLNFQYNNLWNNVINYTNFSADSTNIYRDPMFVRSDSLDYRLQKFSPLIDAGDPTILDLDGTRSDIGLYGGPFGQRYIYQDLPPKPPVNLTALVDTGRIMLRWNRNTEADTSHYNIFRSLNPDFTADSTTLFGSTTDTFFVDKLNQEYERLYYKITCVDRQGNQSNPSEELAIVFSSINDYPITINDYYLYQNYPNPFNPTTKIGYRLKEDGYVKLYVYNIKGELVDILVNQYQQGGYYEVEFNVGNSLQTVPQTLIASGIYIYQIMVRGRGDIPVFTDSKKMLFIK
ncbi:hypothetical protein [Ignavibacterium sp.]|uniref:hypothetical protein n=1 Tax=Ignavibacterium sp. TaxID=2651167 RepID=UPI0022071E81|nr:hypothetical protein [Ignavibacterium sp.]BDQ02439.1 MAG: hypothetical protein KatS3mg037_1014 [Ignavibacterium sp.]